MNQASCPCKRTNCPRHGDCDACRAHHQASKRRRPCEKEPEKAAQAVHRLRETVKEAMEIKLGTLQELDGWMELVSRVKDSFPGLETREALEAHRETVQSSCSADRQSVPWRTGASWERSCFQRKKTRFAFLR